MSEKTEEKRKFYTRGKDFYMNNEIISSVDTVNIEIRFAYDLGFFHSLSDNLIRVTQQEDFTWTFQF